MNNYFKIIPFYPVFNLFGLIMFNGGMSIKSLPVLLIYILRFIILEPFRLLEILFFEYKIRKQELRQDPIFILGHWRSGTSHLQHLMSTNPEFVTSTNYRTIFSDCYLLTEKWLKRPLNYLCRKFNIPFSIQRSIMDLNFPAELDMAVCVNASPNCYTWGHLFPKRFNSWFNKFILTKGNTSDKWVEDYDFMIRKLSYMSGGKRIIVKSPGDCGRVAHLAKKYPGAKFIYIHRNPFEVYLSNQYFWKVIQKENSLQKITDQQIHNLIIETYSNLLKTYHEQKNQLSDKNLTTIRFEELQKNSMPELKRIYNELELGELPHKELNELIESNKKYVLKEHPISEDLKNEIKEKWSFAFEEYGYE